ncbi:MAG: hypothetical protein JWP12_3357 [Bacteroidetes bacterium]|nr:hypothetical protein [Bacteroidota bacterium]
MLLLGCKPAGRSTEQHDVFFAIGTSLKELGPQINASWPEAKNNIHIDAWRQVSSVNGYDVSVSEKSLQINSTPDAPALFFLNLGGYKPEEFEEYHYKMIVAAKNESEAIQLAKQTAFYKHTGFKGAASHIDDKYPVDVDDVYPVASILSPAYKGNYTITLTKQEIPKAGDEFHLGYLQLWKIKDDY